MILYAIEQIEKNGIFEPYFWFWKKIGPKLHNLVVHTMHHLYFLKFFAKLKKLHNIKSLL